jgi:hypothetical protein
MNIERFFKEAKKDLKLHNYFYKNFEQDFIDFIKIAKEESVDITKAPLFENLLINNNFKKVCDYIIHKYTFLELYLFVITKQNDFRPTWS